MKTVALVLALIANIVVWGILWQNRASEKAVTGFFAAVATVLVTTIAAVVFSGPAPISQRFVTAFPVYVNDTHEMVHLIERSATIPWRSSVLLMGNYAIAELIKQDPALLDDDIFGQRLYHHLLQRALLEWMATIFGNSWVVHPMRFSIPGVCCGTSMQLPPDDPVYKQGNSIPMEDFRKILGNNKFAGISLGSPFPKSLLVPAGTKIRVKAPSTTDLYDSGIIEIANHLCQITITTTTWAGGRGLGQYEEFRRMVTAVQRKVGWLVEEIPAKASNARSRRARR